MEVWPNFFIVGAPRAGTTSLYDLLNRTDGIYMSKEKEPKYFSKNIKDVDGHIFFRDEEKYLELFKDVKDEIAIGEASTTYLWDPFAPKLIHEQISHAKIIIILRDPIERSYSNYYWRIGSARISDTFSDAIKNALQSKDYFFKGIIINGSWYFEQVKRYLDIFGSKQVKVLIFEEFIKDPQKTVKEVLEFLGVDSKPPEEKKLAHNILTKPRSRIAKFLLQNIMIKKTGQKFLSEHAQELLVRKVLGEKLLKDKMSTKDRIFLENLFRDDVKKLQKLLKIKLPWNWINKK